MDNGDGTLTDNKTGLVREKKTTAVGSGANLAGDAYDVDDLYNCSLESSGPSPANGSAFTDFLDWLSGGFGSCFSGSCDWRLPTRDELASIVDLEAPGCGGGSPCSSGVFGPTVPDFYWSSSSVEGVPGQALGVDFYDGGPGLLRGVNPGGHQALPQLRPCGHGGS